MIQWLTSTGSWYQDLLIHVCPIHNYSKCVTEISSLVMCYDFISDSCIIDNYGSNTKQATLSTFCKIASIILFRFIISYIFLYNIVLLLFGCCHFLQRNKFWVQIIFVRWVLQDIIFVSLLIWIRMPYLLESSETATWGIIVEKLKLHCEVYYPILILVLQHQMINSFYIL